MDFIHDHDHGHTHDHKHASHSKEETLALLTYMISHNRHHAEELHDLAHSADSEAAALIHEAVALFDAGNEKLEKALSIMKGE